MIKTPRQTVVPAEPKRSSTEWQVIDNLIKMLLKEGTISIVDPSGDQFVSNIFVVPKPDGSHRLILNLKLFNQFVKVSHFKIEDHRTVARLITPNSFMATIDLKDAYYLVPIKKSHRKYLRFKINDCLFEYNCLPFGLSCAPWIFTKILKPVMAMLREKGFLSVIYLDDILLLGKTKKECESNIKETLKLFEHLGFLINYKKSNLIPNNVCKYLGFLYNSKDMSLSLPNEKRIRLGELLKKFSSSNECKIRDFSKFLGTLISAAPAIRYSFLYTKMFERQKYLALLKSRGNYEAKMFIPPTLSSDFFWWMNKVQDSSNAIRSDNFQVEIFTDASRSGWGAFYNNTTTFGYWSEEEKLCHINELELLAVFFGLKCFTENFTNCNILCRVDNTTAISTINRMGSVRFENLNNIARKIWGWCEDRGIYVFASYINSQENIADRASRQIHKETEWSLADWAFTKIQNKFGEPKIDLFASRLNKKCLKFVSWIRDPEAYRVDAFTLNWSEFDFYAFPPFSLILRVLQKIINDKAEGIVVIPLWVSQPWYPVFKSLLLSKPIIFEPKSTLLSFSGVPHPLSENLFLAAGRLSGKHYHEDRCLKNH